MGLISAPTKDGKVEVHDEVTAKAIEELHKDKRLWQWVSLGLAIYSAIITTLAIIV